jgi:hypothetical protein
MTRKAKTETLPAEKIRPDLLGKGRYAIYEAPDGAGIVSYRPDDSDQDRHQVVPPRAWKVIRAALAGEMDGVSPTALLRMMLRG